MCKSLTLLGENMVEILDEITLSRSGCYRRIRRYLRGVHPDRGPIVMGLTGWETVEDVDVIIPLLVVNVSDTIVVPFMQKIEEPGLELVAVG